MNRNSFFSELRKRKVLQSAAIYGAVAWGVTEVTVTVVEQLFLPQWVATLAVIFFVVGFPVAMFLSWTFDITGKGIRRTDVSRRRGAASIIVSMLLLISGTAGLFLLIKPAMNAPTAPAAPADVPPYSLAVLPFDNASPDPDDAYLSGGLSDELRDQLGRMQGLRLAARSSSLAAMELNLDAMAISARLGVAHLVEGSLRRNGNRLRVSVQLIEGASGLTLWSEVFERGPGELLTIQETIAREVAERVLPEEEIQLAAPATRNASANELMLLANHYERQVRNRQIVDHSLLLKAVQLYRQAAELDPQSALAHSRLAGALLFLGDIDAAEAPIFKAISLNNSLSEVQNTLGEFYWARGLPESGAAWARAVNLNPNNAEALHNYAHWLWMHSRMEQVEALYRRALALDPLALRGYAALGDFYGKEGLVDKALGVVDEVQQNFDSVESMRLVGWVLELTGRVDEAIGWTLRARDREPENSDHNAKLAELHASIGDFETAVALEPQPGPGLLFRLRRYAELIEQAEWILIETPEDISLRYLLAFAHNASGNFETALHVLAGSGVPETILEGTARSAADFDAFSALIDALVGSGNEELAVDLVNRSEEQPFTNDIDWWMLVPRVCGLELNGRREEALGYFTRIGDSARLPWMPVIYDSVCLGRLADTTEYRDTIERLEQRRAELRLKLPATLASMGVSL